MKMFLSTCKDTGVWIAFKFGWSTHVKVIVLYAGMQQLLETKTHLESKNKEDEDAYRVKKKTFDLLPNANENIAKLQVRLHRKNLTVRSWNLVAVLKM